MIFLSILKIIGIVFACLVGFLLFLVLMILAAPIQYKIHSEGKNSETVITGSAKWIFGLAGVKFAYVNYTFGYKVKVAFLKIRMEKFPKKESDLPLKQEEPTPRQTQDMVARKEKTTDNFSVNKEDAVITREPEEKEKSSEDIPEIEYVNLKNTEKKSRKDPSKKKAKERWKEKEIKRESFLDKINRWTEKYEKVKELLDSELMKRALKCIKIQILNILNHIKPKKIAGKLNFGLEDPSNTAIIYGLIGSVTEMISNNKLIITPEFYQKGVSSDISISGSIFLGYVVLCFVRLVMDKNVKSAFRKIRRIV